MHKVKRKNIKYSQRFLKFTETESRKIIEKFKELLDTKITWPPIIGGKVNNVNALGCMGGYCPSPVYTTNDGVVMNNMHIHLLWGISEKFKS